MTASSNRLLMIALDGGDLKFIRRRLDRLPTMRAALEKGGLIETTMPPGLPGAAWHTFTNACEPGKHGLYQHLIWNPARMGRHARSRAVAQMSRRCFSELAKARSGVRRPYAKRLLNLPTFTGGYYEAQI